jgi:subtilisin family serine protease
VITASSLVSTPVQIKVVALGGSPISRAAITLFGKGYPQHAVTDDNGLATLSVFGGDCRTVTYLYVKPYSGYWECWQEKPHLEFEAVNTVVLKPLDPAVDLPGGLGWGQRLMGLDQLGGERFTGEGAKIAIIDSGCDTQHQALNHIKKGYDFTNPDAVAAASSWTNDTMGHGTHCAGIIAGNGRGMRGFAPKADIHILKLFEGGAFDALMAALAYAAREGIDVVNCSLGSEEISEAVMVRLEQARQAGVAVIVAAGNSAGQVQFPARLPNVLAVSAIGRTGAFPQDSYHAETIPEPGTPGVNIGQNGLFAARFSCFGPEVDVCAPGVAIISTVPGGAYAAWDGTSMAAPHITGLAALVAAHHPAFANNAMPRDASRVDNLFQIVLSIAKSVGLAREYAGAGLPAGGSFAAVNGQLPAAPANQALPPDFESKIRVIVTATLGLMQKNGELGRIPPI